MQSIPGTCSICSLQEFEVRDRGAEFLEAPFTAGNVGSEQVLMVTASRAPNIRRFHFLRLQRRAPSFTRRFRPNCSLSTPRRRLPVAVTIDPMRERSVSACRSAERVLKP